MRPSVTCGSCGRTRVNSSDGGVRRRTRATVVDHDLTPGGSVTYFMTGPEGDQPRGWWRVLAVDAPHRLEFEDGFADEAGDPNPDMPTMTIRVTLNEQPDGGKRMAVKTTFPSVETMEQILSMGMGRA